MTNEMYSLAWDAPTRMYGYGFVCDGRDIVLGLLWDKKYIVLYTCTHTYIIHLYTCMRMSSENYLPSGLGSEVVIVIVLFLCTFC